MKRRFRDTFLIYTAKGMEVVLLLLNLAIFILWVILFLRIVFGIPYRIGYTWEEYLCYQLLWLTAVAEIVLTLIQRYVIKRLNARSPECLSNIMTTFKLALCVFLQYKVESALYLVMGFLSYFIQRYWVGAERMGEPWEKYVLFMQILVSLTTIFAKFLHAKVWLDIFSAKEQPEP